MIVSGRFACRVRRFDLRRNVLRWISWFTLVAFALPMTQVAAAQPPSPDFITVKTREFAPRLVAYGQVESIAVVPVSAAETGVVTDLKVRPGSRVRAGEVLARLSGPAISALLMQSENDVRSAKTQLDTAEKSLAIEQQQFPSHLTTRQAVQQAESVRSQAHTALENARSKLKSVRAMMTLTSPADGIVVALSSANGALVSSGQPVLTLQPSGGLWLRATYYGADLSSIRVGMNGEFDSSAGGPPTPVRVVSVPGTLTAGGGESIALEPTDGHIWLNGESGTVTLLSASQKLVAIPTRALIVNQGKWWVLVHTAHGNHVQEVVPGPTVGWETLVESGLPPGTQIIVNNAYLLFHSGIAEQFQIPD